MQKRKVEIGCNKLDIERHSPQPQTTASRKTRTRSLCEPTNEHKDLVLQMYRKHLVLRKQQKINPITDKKNKCKGMGAFCREVERLQGLRNKNISRITMMK